MYRYPGVPFGKEPHPGRVSYAGRSGRQSKLQRGQGTSVMGKDGFKQPAAAFKNSCRVYLKEKERVKALEAKYPALAENGFNPETFRVDLSEDNGQGNLELYQFLKDDIRFVEETFDKIYRLCGNNAKVLIWSLFVENRIQTDVADEFGLTRRQLQYSVDKWLKEVFTNG